MATHYDQLKAHSQWLVRSGSRGFCLDNWTGDILLGPHPVDAILTIAQGLRSKYDR